MKRIVQLVVAAGIFMLSNTVRSQTISNHYFGVNAWMSDTIGDVSNCLSPPCIKNGKVHKQWQKIKDSGAEIVRYGGIAPDKNKPTMYQYLRMVDSIRAKGMEPLIQVPFWDNRYSATDAAAIVNYINVVKGRNVKYWIIANEPNLSYSYTAASQIALYFKAYASAMKNVDPSIIIVGPETASFKQAITDGLTNPGGPYDITGKDAMGRYYLDVFSFHTYPMHDGLGTRAEALTKLTDAGDLQDDLAYLNGKLSAANTYHNRTGTHKLKIAVTEANIVYTNAPTDDLYGIGANSFFGAQFVAEMYGIGLKQGVDFINLWSVVEGGSSIPDNCGYIDGGTGKKKPLYWHFQMMAENFHGNSVNATDNQTTVKSFACQDAGETSVMLLNQDLSNNYSYTLRLNNASVTGTSALKINVDGGIAQNYSDVLPNQSSVILTFNSAGTLIRKTEYSLSAQAVGDQPPLVTNYGLTTGVEDGAANNDDGIFEATLYPNPSNGKFTIELAGGNKSEKIFHVDVINLLGQQVYDKELEFHDGKELIEMQEGYAQGAYIVRIREDERTLVKKIILNK
jgi:hypothetical protein